MRGALVGLLLAYIMPSYGVLKRFANQRDDLSVSSFTAAGVAAVSPAIAKDVAGLLGTTWNSGELTLNASLSVRLPGRCRLELSSPDSTKVLLSTWASGKQRNEGGELEPLRIAVEHACALLSPKSGEDGATRDALARHLTGLKVDLKQTSLARFYGSVSYLVGQKLEGQPQLWVYKDRFLPSRLRFTDAAGAQWDVRFSDYTSQATGDAWPRVLEVYKGNEPQLRVMLLNADLKADLTNTKF